jgi:hypothetical protein
LRKRHTFYRKELRSSRRLKARRRSRLTVSIDSKVILTLLLGQGTQSFDPRLTDIYITSKQSSTILQDYMESQIHVTVLIAPFDCGKLLTILNTFYTFSLRSVSHFRNTFEPQSCRRVFLNYVNYFFPSLEVSKKFIFAFLNSLKTHTIDSSRISAFKKILIGEGLQEMEKDIEDLGPRL